MPVTQIGNTEGRSNLKGKGTEFKFGHNEFEIPSVYAPQST